ncbi:MAG: O-methyltransferase [Acidimicrobiales bacterium]
MAETTWTEVDRFLVDHLIGPDADLEAALEASAGAGLPPIAVSAPQGRLLYLLARIRGARSILELGTLGGYSTLWLARALPEDGRLVTLELRDRHAEVARANLARAGLADRVEVRVGPALDSLASLEREGAGPFDLVFIDADKPSNPDYFAACLRLCAPGSVIVADNVVRGGSVADAASTDADVRGAQAMIEAMGDAPQLEATAIQTVGEKGYDGFALAVVTGAMAG